MDPTKQPNRITDFFKVLKDKKHKVDSAKASANVDEVSKQEEQQVVHAGMERKRDEDEERRLRARIDTEDGKTAAARTEEEIIREEIARFCSWSDEDEEYIYQKKSWNRRPPHWRNVGEYALVHGVGKAFFDHEQDFTCNRETAFNQIYRWMKDVKNNKEPTLQRTPVYGTAIDNELLEAFKIRQHAGLSVTYALCYFLFWRNTGRAP